MGFMRVTSTAKIFPVFFGQNFSRFFGGGASRIGELVDELVES